MPKRSRSASDEQRVECSVCFEELDDTDACWPCGHAVCTQCEPRFVMHACPLCRATPEMGYDWSSDFAWVAVWYGATRRRYVTVDLQNEPGSRRVLRLARRSGDVEELRQKVIRVLIDHGFWRL